MRKMMTSRQRMSLTTFIHAKRRRTREPTSSSEVRDSADSYSVGHFGPQHGLTPGQAWVAQHLLNRANQLRPIQGSSRSVRFRRALRIAGIVSAVKRGTVGNSHWGRSMLARRGGQTLARHALDHFRRISPLGVRAKAMNQMSRDEQIAFAVAEVQRVRRHGTDSG
ncbi:hypothetical protein AYO43_03185 [Nitrospira sp. SCGC AG-212-E16]|nr:hypothetical protein AYO43_03185 [Nitrospira sp. SCGC AG-212-E16]